MGCNKAKHSMGEPISDERRNELIAARDAARRDAVEKLRESGLVVVAQASEHRVHVIADRIEWSYIDGKLSYAIDGVDISDMIQGFSTVVVKQNDFPVDTLILKNKPLIVPRTKPQIESEQED